MWQRLQAWLRPEAPDTLALARTLQSLRLDLEARDTRLKALTQEVERLRRGEELRVGAAVQARLQPLLADCALPLSHLTTQAHLVEVLERPVAARDVLALVKRLIRAFEDQGLVVAGDIGALVPYDPAHHEPLGGVPAPGTPVVVRFAGVAFEGAVLRKAGVELVGG